MFFFLSLLYPVFLIKKVNIKVGLASTENPEIARVRDSRDNDTLIISHTADMRLQSGINIFLHRYGKLKKAKADAGSLPKLTLEKATVVRGNKRKAVRLFARMPRFA